MRKEIIGIFLFFLVIFTLGSFLSYSPEDPSIHNAKAAGNVHNLFGIFGAHVSGILIGLFGLGASWIPILFLLSSVHFFGDYHGKAIILIIAGGIILIISTGSLFAFQQNHLIIFGSKFSSGGIIGIPIKSFLIKYTNHTGSAVILILMWLIGFIMATGFSLIIFLKRFWKLLINTVKSTKKLIILWKERSKKAKKRSKIKKDLEIKIAKSRSIREAPVPKQDVFEFMKAETGFQLPSINLLEDPAIISASADDKNLKMQSKLLEKKLGDFGVQGKVATILPGPVITTFEYEPASGIKISKIVGLTDDLALALRSISVRIVAPIPGKAAIGIELPNATRETVRLKEIVNSNNFEKSKSEITICLGKDIIGNPVVAELDKMPHLLIAGATGTGKSVALNAMICSFLFKANPDELKLIMIDPKRIELSNYDGIPHLITPVVTDVKKATNALFWAVHEMENRYKLLSEMKVKNIKQYNQKIAKEKTKEENGHRKLPYIVIIIDELADLMMVASRDVEVALTRLAQMARAAGIHLILATQRPSVDVLTGIIKANFPTRLSFQVSSKTDSRTIIDTNGAENLLGNGDMLFLPPGTAKLQRIHGAYISEEEISGITEFLKEQKIPEYNNAVITESEKEKTSSKDLEYDEKYDEAIALITNTGQASISMIQRHLRIGYNRAARIIEIMEKEGVVGPSDGVKPREVLVRSYDKMP
ncbi:MAG: DNA translocase FtsK [Desulfobacteraceae bacterium]|nr:DNA translocase FtsK [Desulfobacteraceae bacterium]MBC2719600.1 DNA translocase FtsK 4TM domain-containing protein [Desulfobacteraceae bacterium]